MAQPARELPAFDLTVLMYHYVRDPGDRCEAGSGIPGLPTRMFEAQLDRLSRENEMVNWPAVRAHLLSQRGLPARACLLTFDDGVCDHYENVFPRLKARGLSGLFFGMARAPGAGLTLAHRLHYLLPVLGLDGLREAVRALLNADRQAAFEAAEVHYRGVWPDPVDAFKSALQRELAPAADAPLSRLVEQHVGSETALAEALHLSAAQTAEMLAGGMHFGGHGQAHQWLDWESSARVAAEAQASADWLRGLAPGPWAFAYPYGGYDERTPGLLARSGFCAAFTTRPQVRHASAFHIGRLDGEALPEGVGASGVGAFSEGAFS
jgi:peptidoglycan/xylan/chitin deacetylase (PgdA/CDA1 family)